NVMARSGADFRGSARRKLKVGYVIDRDGDPVLLPPVAGKAIDPPVVLGDEMAPLQDLEGLGFGKSRRDERRRNRWRQARGAGRYADGLEKIPPGGAAAFFA